MVVDCEKLKQWDPDHLFENVVANGRKLRPGQIHYKDFQRLNWLDPALIQPLDPRWNHYNMLRDDTRLVHFSHVREQPWRWPGHPLMQFWDEWLGRAVAAGYVTPRQVVREVALLRLHPRFLRHARG